MSTSLSVEIIDGVKITTRYDENGDMISQSIMPLENSEKCKNQTAKNNGPLKTIWDWCRNLFYVKQRDLSDPFDKRRDDPFDDGSGSKNCIEAGVKISF